MTEFRGHTLAAGDSGMGNGNAYQLGDFPTYCDCRMRRHCCAVRAKALGRTCWWQHSRCAWAVSRLAYCAGASVRHWQTATLGSEAAHWNAVAAKVSLASPVFPRAPRATDKASQP